MQLHGNAKLTVKQRIALRRLYQEEGRSISSLETEFKVSKKTIQKWIHRDSPLDQKMSPSQRGTVVSEAYRQDILNYRQQHPTHGKLRIAQALSFQYPHARPSHVLRVLQKANLIGSKPSEPREKKPLKTGRYRVQMDVQQLPAVKGNSGYEYKISLIHLRTRMKYSEIHSEQTTLKVAEVLHRAMDRLPPFF